MDVKGWTGLNLGAWWGGVLHFSFDLMDVVETEMDLPKAVHTASLEKLVSWRREGLVDRF